MAETKGTRFLKDPKGRRFGRLVVLVEELRGRSRRYLLCRCDCGAEKAIRADGVERGAVLSCGCWSREWPRSRLHGYWDKPEYQVWLAIKRRCRNPKDKQFHDYGGRGIDVCQEWHDSFPRFIAAVGPRPGPGLSIERIDNARGYEPGNVVWATRKEQQRNTRSNRLLAYRGRTQCVAAWAEEFGLTHATLTKRLRLGWSLHVALTTPVLPRGWRLRKAVAAAMAGERVALVESREPEGAGHDSVEVAS